MTQKQIIDISDVHLICDLDGTLLKNDFFFEKLLEMLIINPLSVFYFLNRSITEIKKGILKNSINTNEINALINPNVAILLKDNKKKYKSLSLISASPDEFVKKIAKQIEIFDLAIGSDNYNLKGKSKLNYILENNLTPYVYIGDSSADNILFKHSLFYYKVNSDNSLSKHENIS